MKKLFYYLFVTCILLIIVTLLGIVGNFDYSVETSTEEQTTIYHYLALAIFVGLSYLFKYLHDRIED